MNGRLLDVNARFPVIVPFQKSILILSLKYIKEFINIPVFFYVLVKTALSLT